MDISIQVDIEELIEMLNIMLEDDYGSVILTIEPDTYNTVLKLKGAGLSDEDSREYGCIESYSSDF